MFDKTAYRKRREQGLRGQEDLTPAPKIALWTEEDYKAGKCGKKQIGKERTSGVTMHMTRKGMIAVTRKMNRRKVVDRHSTKSGFQYGARIGSKLFNIAKHKEKHAIGKAFGKPIVTEITDSKGKVHTSTHYTFPAKSRHLRSVSGELSIHLERAAEIEAKSGRRYGETNKQRFARHKEERDAAKNSTRRTASSAA